MSYKDSGGFTQLLSFPSVLAFLLALGLSATQGCHAQPYDAAPQSMSIMSWNVEWMFDDYLGDNRSKVAREQSAPSPRAWQAKLAAVAKVIADQAPWIVALQEIEGEQTLAAIANEIRRTHQLAYRVAFIQGTDSFTEQDVGLLVRSGMVSYSRQEQSKAMYESGLYYNLSKHLFAEFRWAQVEQPLTILNVHLRAGEQARTFRVRQARLARHWLESRLASGQDVVMLGDFNSEAACGQKPDELASLLEQTPHDGLVDLLTRLDDAAQPTHLIVDRQFDRILVSRSMFEDGPGLDWAFESISILRGQIIRGQADGPAHWRQRLDESYEELDISDHFPVIAKFRLK